ncbi:hypothetical protein BKA70DRAFT_1451713 [Coprinopsis sp. MPI-PUGE-AT-0042]|nr:hypothetical protein BKA70DRAFT_1451713 [Coprinopsis sp. MPI-PUGE-AT-0042]
MICEALFPSFILAVKTNRKTLVIALETEIYIYDISNMRLLHNIEMTSNPDAICALSYQQTTRISPILLLFLHLRQIHQRRVDHHRLFRRV